MWGFASLFFLFGLFKVLFMYVLRYTLLLTLTSSSKFPINALLLLFISYFVQSCASFHICETDVMLRFCVKAFDMVLHPSNETVI